MRCIKKDVTAQAFRYDGELKGADGRYHAPGWVAEAFEKGILFYARLNEGEPPTELFVRTSYEKRLHIPQGYYIVRDGYGEIGRLSPTLFHDIYEEWAGEDLEGERKMSDAGRLRPCPFCGGKAIVNTIEPHTHKISKFISDYEGGTFIECTACTCGISGETEQEAIDSWNKRA